ncbi:MAG: hypothetical protein AAFQ85_07510 [Pseudomonadota bacterium]
MSDRLFFPLAALLALGLVALGLQPALGALPSGSVSGGGTDYSEVTLEGADLNRIIGGGESDIDLIARGEDDYVLRIETGIDNMDQLVEEGPHFRLAADLENVFQGRTLEVTVRARPADEAGARAFVVNYYAGQVGESGWQRFLLTPDFEDHTFALEVPLRIGPQGVDFLGVRPSTLDKPRAILIERVTLRPLTPMVDSGQS